MMPLSFERAQHRAEIQMRMAERQHRARQERTIIRQPDDPGPILINMAAIDAARHRAAWRKALVLALGAALITAAIVGPLMLRDWDRISNAVCAGESVV